MRCGGAECALRDARFGEQSSCRGRRAWLFLCAGADLQLRAAHARDRRLAVRLRPFREWNCRGAEGEARWRRLRVPCPCAPQPPLASDEIPESADRKPALVLWD